MADHCCEFMTAQVNFVCAVHAPPDACPDKLIDYSAMYREYGIAIHDGGTSSITIAYCPWCGAKFPESLRNRWFEELERLGFSSPLFDDAVPEMYLTDAWYLCR